MQESNSILSADDLRLPTNPTIQSSKTAAERKDCKNATVQVDFPALTDFLAYLSGIKGRSALTIKEYHYDLVLFFRYYKILQKRVPHDLDFRAIPLDDITEADLNQIDLKILYSFIGWLANEKKASTANRSRKIATLRSFFKYHHTKTRLIKENPAAELESPKQLKKQPRYLEVEESKQLLQTVAQANCNFSQRDYCILTLFLNCGLRLAELCGINLGDIGEDTLRVLGKGGKERTVYLNGACIAALNAYLPERKQQKNSFNSAEKKQAETPLFISRQGNRISHPAVQLLVRKYIILAGLDPHKYTPHKLRHTAATLMYKYGHVDIRMLQQILGHSSVATTEIYTHLDADSLHNAVEKNPLADERSC